MMNKQNRIPVFIGLLLLTLIACGGGSDVNTASPGGTATAETPAATATQGPVVEAQATEVPVSDAMATEVPVSGATATENSATKTQANVEEPTDGSLFLQLVEPSEAEVIIDSSSLVVSGRTRIDALVTINDTIVEPNIDGEFSLDMPLEEGPNIIEIVSSVADGEQMDLVLVAIYIH